MHFGGNLYISMYLGSGYSDEIKVNVINTI